MSGVGAGGNQNPDDDKDSARMPSMPQPASREESDAEIRARLRKEEERAGRGGGRYAASARVRRDSTQQQNARTADTTTQADTLLHRRSSIEEEKAKMAYPAQTVLDTSTTSGRIVKSARRETSSDLTPSDLNLSISSEAPADDPNQYQTGVEPDDTSALKGVARAADTPGDLDDDPGQSEILANNSASAPLVADAFDEDTAGVHSNKDLRASDKIVGTGMMEVAAIAVDEDEEEKKMKELLEKNKEYEERLKKRTEQAVEVLVVDDKDIVTEDEIEEEEGSRLGLIVTIGCVLVVVVVIVVVLTQTVFGGSGAMPSRAPSPAPTLAPTGPTSPRPTNLPSDQPSYTPSLRPSSSSAPTNTPCFKTTSELHAAVDQYVDDSTVTSNVAKVYGWPLGAWCFEETLEDFSETFSVERNSLVADLDFSETNIENWDVSRATTMRAMFKGAVNFDEPIGQWEVGRVTDMSSMFENVNKFDQNLNFWDVSKVTTMSRMFARGAGLSQESLASFEIGSWDVSNVMDMSFMFTSHPLNKPLDQWNVARVEDFQSMFDNAAFFNQDLSTWNISSGRSFRYTFRNNAAFSQDLCAWGSKIRENASVIRMFGGSVKCPFDTDPDLSRPIPGPFCFSCDTEAPTISMAPTNQPSTLQPTIMPTLPIESGAPSTTPTIP